MTEKVKTVIEFYFLLPNFKSRGHPRYKKVCWFSPGQFEAEVVFHHLHELYIVIKRAVSRKHFREAQIRKL